MKQLFTLILSLSLTPGFSQITADFENFNLEPETFLNGGDNTGGFSSGDIFLPNMYDAGFDFWQGWSISNTTDTISPGFANQYSAISGTGAEGTDTYAVGYSLIAEYIIHLSNDAIGEIVEGLYVTNSTFAYRSMQNGDDFAKRFGGVSGDDPDYFLLTIKGFLNGMPTSDSIDFYLADYRFSDNSMDYIVDEWTYIDLQSLGAVDSLFFSLSSTDVGIFGMNTPAYFCVDQLTTLGGTSATMQPVIPSINLYPIPSKDFLIIEHAEMPRSEMHIYNLSGQLLYRTHLEGIESKLDIHFLERGNYIMELKEGDQIYTSLFQKL